MQTAMVISSPPRIRYIDLPQTRDPDEQGGVNESDGRKLPSSEPIPTIGNEPSHRANHQQRAKEASDVGLYIRIAVMCAMDVNRQFRSH